MKMNMQTLQLLREIYLEGFRDLGNPFLKNYLKVFSYFNFFLIIVALYAMTFRLVTGFQF